jgi:2-succinyl-5-enolpyruvyl-6-hydroxy-3-cyclohexene-1-carboxylate synthase
MNALGIRHLKNNVRVLLINNGGGAEFKVMTRHWKERVNVDGFISACGHNGNARGWAENCGFTYLTASSKQEFVNVKEVFLAAGENPVLLEVFTNGEDEQKAIELFTGKNRITTSEDKLKHLVGSILGPQGVSIIKKIIKQ